MPECFSISKETSVIKLSEKGAEKRNRRSETHQSQDHEDFVGHGEDFCFCE